MADTTAQMSKTVTVVDERNMVRLWLEEKVSRGEMSPAQADAALKDYEDKGKLWIGPTKDMYGAGTIIYRLARDMKSLSGAKVYFKKGAKGDLVIIEGRLGGRTLLTAARYKVDNPKMIELQIGKPGIVNAAKESARFGVYLVVAVDIADYIINRDRTTLGQLLGTLSVDIPSVVVASAVGGMVGGYFASTAATGALAVVGTFACGPLIVALVVSAAVGYGLYMLDQHYHLSDTLGKQYDIALAKLDQARKELGAEAEQRFKQLENSALVHDLNNSAQHIAQVLGRESEIVMGRLSHLL